MISELQMSDNSQNEERSKNELGFQHKHIAAETPQKLLLSVEPLQEDGFELINVIHADKLWNAFLKRANTFWAADIHAELSEINSAWAMMLKNDIQLATSDDIAEIKSLLDTMLEILENHFKD
jgi:hypothetical protein